MEIAAAGDDNKALRKVARALLDKAATGDVGAIREIADRLDGKVPHRIGGDQETDPVSVTIVKWADAATDHGTPASGKS